MGLRQKIGLYLQNKLGVTEVKLHLNNHLEFLSTYINLALPEHIRPSAHVLAYSRTEIEKRYGLRHFNEVIHKNDIMFQHHLRKDLQQPDQALFHYYNVGLDALKKIKELTEKQNDVQIILDFGAGYGRGSRFIPYFFPHADVYVSEVKEQAMLFQQREFGFNIITHTEKASSFSSKQFDLVIAISVFSHLPQNLFRQWLKVLFGTLKPGGILFFTYNEMRHRPELNKTYHFISQSEDEGMSWVTDRIKKSETYGSAFYTESLMQEIIKSTLNIEAQFIQNFSGRQDGVLVRADKN